MFKNLFLFNWRIISFQYCIGFCHISNESAIGIDMSSPSRTFLPPHHTPLGCHRAPDLSSLHHSANFHCLILCMVMYMFQCYSLNLSYPLLPPLCPQVLYLCVRLILRVEFYITYLCVSCAYHSLQNFFFPLKDD